MRIGYGKNLSPMEETPPGPFRGKFPCPEVAFKWVMPNYVFIRLIHCTTCVCGCIYITYMNISYI